MQVQPSVSSGMFAFELCPLRLCVCVPNPPGNTELSREELFHRIRNFDLYTCDILISPIITGMHITAVIVDKRSKEIVHVDSVGNGNRQYAIELQNMLQEHWEWRVAHGGPEEGPYPIQDWICRGSSSNSTPQQMDGVACGIFATGFATLQLLQIPMQYFSQALVPRMRLHVANCLLTQTCILPWCMNEHGHRLGIYIEPGATERHYRQRLRTGNRRDPTEFQARHREARRQGSFFDLDQPSAKGPSRCPRR